MAIYNAQQLISASNATYFTNTSGGISASAVRDLNDSWVSSSALLSGSNSFIGNQTISGSLTAQLPANYIWLGNSSGYSQAVATSSISLQGAQGLQGTQGPQGTQGTQGVQGTSGSQGLQGIQGVSGSQGVQGVSGQFVQGSQGADGTQGATGQLGTQGIQGGQGFTGGAGQNGTQGAQGATGTGTQGATGAQGSTGASNAFFNYQAKDTITSGDPLSGHIIWNNATQASATSISVSDIDQNSNNLDVFLSNIEVGTTIVLQDQSSQSNYQKWEITSRTDNTTYWTYGVTLITSTYSFPNNHQMLFVISAGAQGAQGAQGTTGQSIQGAQGFQGVQGATGAAAQLVINNNNNNNVLTATGTSTLQGENNLTFDGSLLNVAGNVNVVGNQTITGSVFISGSTTLRNSNLIFTGSAGGAPLFIQAVNGTNLIISSSGYMTFNANGLGIVQNNRNNDFTMYSNMAKNATFGAFASQSAYMNVGVYDPDNYTYDNELQITAEPSGGITFSDWDNGTNFVYVPWLKTIPNDGSNPAPIFTRGLDVSGSLYVSGNIYATNLTGSSINTGSFATTGSNQFNGDQTITGSLNVKTITTLATAATVATPNQSTGTLLIFNYNEYTCVPTTPCMNNVANSNGVGWVISGTGITDGTVTSAQYGNDGVEVNITSGNVVSGSSYIATGPFYPYLIISGAVYGDSGFNSPGGFTVQNLDGTGNPYSNIGINVDTTTDPANVFSAVYIAGQTSEASVQIALSSYTNEYPGQTVPTIYAGGYYNGSDTTMTFYSSSIQNWKPTQFKAGAQITGSLLLNNGLTIKGSTTFVNSSGNSNVFIGGGALSSNTTGIGNVAIGQSAMNSNTTGNNNFAFGTNTLQYNTTGNNNFAAGASAGRYTSGSGNVFIGDSAGQYITGSSNVILGGYSGVAGTTLTENIILSTGGNIRARYNSGWQFPTSVSIAGNTTITGSLIQSGTLSIQGDTTFISKTGTTTNVILGGFAMGAISGSVQNSIAIGFNAMRYSSGSDQNTAIGYNTLPYTRGGNNFALGSQALQENTTGGENIGIGVGALNKNTTGGQNIAIGSGAGFYNETGSKNVYLGYHAGQNITGSNNLILGGYAGSGETINNNIILADGAGNIKARYNESIWQLTGSLDVLNTFTASLANGYTWVGDSNNRTTLVATSSFGGGSQGAQGPAGQATQGTQGTTGAQGSTTQGAQGANGAQGADGTQGAGGSQGAAGQLGTQGQSGAQGTAGTVGQSIQGAQGANGASVQGAQGTAGASNQYGYQGLNTTASLTLQTGTVTFTTNTNVTSNSYQTGNRIRLAYQSNPSVYWEEGVITAYTTNQMTVLIDLVNVSGGTFSGFDIGITGQQGNIGLQGIQGTAGQAGATGGQGIQGNTGAGGQQGAQGATGTGTQGAQGASGTNGTNGTNGSQGAAGGTGAQGSSGGSGAQGSTGGTGAQGNAGSNGSNGSQGATGATGAQGATGATGSGFSTISPAYNNALVISNASSNSAFTNSSIYVSGNTIYADAFYQNSSRELKTNIIAFDDDAIALLKRVSVVTFYYKNDTFTPHIGFIAEDTPQELSGINQNMMDVPSVVGTLIKAVQQLQAQNDSLVARIEALENR